MKVWITLTSLFFCCKAAVILTPRNPDDVGAAVTFQNQDALGQYDFGYSEGHPSGASFRRETGDALGNKVGSFGLRDADGRLRIVRYVADENGFRADVTSNEPGVAPQDPASATINKPSIVPVAPVALPPPPPPAAVAVSPKVFPPPPPQYNVLAPAPYGVAPPPPPPPSSKVVFPPPAPVAPVVSAPVQQVFPAPVRQVFPAPVQQVFPAPVQQVYPAPQPLNFPAPLAPVGPVAVAPVGKAVAYPPPPAYFTNLVQGKGYVNALRSYASLLPPVGYLSVKSPPTYQALGYPL